MAVTVGFEPTVGGYPTQLFESCTFGRSDTSPQNSLRESAPRRESAPAARGGRQMSMKGLRRPASVFFHPRQPRMPPSELVRMA